uniref:Secreted protein n=1 Tax=Ascaris lumbricoides TaxID=6252 RepID=A0A0M3IT65_ASCLU
MGLQYPCFLLSAHFLLITSTKSLPKKKTSARKKTFNYKIYNTFFYRKCESPHPHLHLQQPPTRKSVLSSTTINYSNLETSVKSGNIRQLLRNRKVTKKRLKQHSTIASYICYKTNKTRMTSKPYTSNFYIILKKKSSAKALKRGNREDQNPLK